MLNRIDANGIMPLPVLGGVKVIDVRKIMRIEASSNYSKLHFVDGKTLVVAKLLSWFEAVLQAQPFYRIHRTHLVNKHFVQQYIKGEGGKVKLQNGDLLNVSKRRKAYFLQSWQHDGFAPLPHTNGKATEMYS